MVTQTIGTFSPTSAVQRTGPTSKGFKDLSSEDFFGLLIAQLRSQDPLKPTDNEQLLQQMSTIRQMEQSSTLNRTLNSLAGDQRFGATSSMIGKYVFGTVTDAGGNRREVQGLVVGVRFNRDGRAILDLHNGQSLPSPNVEEVTLLDNLPAEIRDSILIRPPAQEAPPEEAASGETAGRPAPAESPGARSALPEDPGALFGWRNPAARFIAALMG